MQPTNSQFFGRIRLFIDSLAASRSTNDLTLERAARTNAFNYFVIEFGADKGRSTQRQHTLDELRCDQSVLFDLR
jgi:hypothetical protein